MRSTVSILGVYEYDNTVLDGFAIPANVSRETFLMELFRNCAELELLYSDPDVLRPMLKYWSENRLPIWEELEKTLHYEYNPIENYDRREDWSDDSVSEACGNSNTTSSIKTNHTTTNKIAAFNAPADDQLKTRDTTNNIADDKSTSSGDTTTNTSAGSNHSGRIHGNIGVTTTQAMIKEQRDVVQFSVIEYIVNDFKHDFCLMIY